MNACAFPDGVLHDHGNAQCHEATYEAGRRDAQAALPVSSPLTAHAEQLAALGRLRQAIANHERILPGDCACSMEVDLRTLRLVADLADGKADAR